MRLGDNLSGNINDKNSTISYNQLRSAHNHSLAPLNLHTTIYKSPRDFIHHVLRTVICVVEDLEEKDPRKHSLHIQTHIQTNVLMGFGRGKGGRKHMIHKNNEFMKLDDHFPFLLVFTRLSTKKNISRSSVGMTSFFF